MARAVIYTRVSTDEQSRSGLGLEAQEAAAREHAARRGHQDGPSFADAGVSGAAPLDRRPALLEALGALRRGDALVVAKRDRLGRDPILVAMIERLVARRGARILSAAGEGTDGDGPTDVLMRRIVDAFAEYERLVIGARTRAALAAKRARGQKTGGQAPYGFTVGGDGRTLVAHPAEQRVLDRIRELQAEGLSIRAIVERLARLGVRTRSGRPWSRTLVWRVLRREAA